jgi:hypothetical protein
MTLALRVACGNGNACGRAAAGYGRPVLLTVLVWGGLIAAVVLIVRTLRNSRMSRPEKVLSVLGCLVMILALLFIGALAGVR